MPFDILRRTWSTIWAAITSTSTSTSTSSTSTSTSISTSTSTSPRSYKHKPLENPDNTIRLLHLDYIPNEGEGPIEISLEQVPVDELGQHHYVALSYTWTKHTQANCANSPPHILIDGCRMTIGENLSDFLRSAAARKCFEQKRPLFIDSIGIDQMSDEEKTCQLPLMSRIYENARRTIVWLGQSDLAAQSQLRRANSGFGQAYTAAQLRRANSGLGQACTAAQLRRANTGLSQDIRGLHSKILCQLVNNTYWERMWVVAELFLSSEVDVCIGDETLSWSTIVCVADWQPSDEEAVVAKVVDAQGLDVDDMEQRQAVAERIEAMIETVKAKEKWDRGIYSNNQAAEGQASLLRLMQRFSERKCADERDRIYALLPLVPACQIVVNYGQYHIFDLFRQVVGHVFSEIENFPKLPLEPELLEITTFLFHFWSLSQCDRRKAAKLLKEKREKIMRDRRVLTRPKVWKLWEQVPWRGKSGRR